jgi:uncharacterized membrane protein YqjE
MSSKRLPGILRTIFQTQLELLSNEKEEECVHIKQMFGSVALFLFILSIMLPFDYLLQDIA